MRAPRQPNSAAANGICAVRSSVAGIRERTVRSTRAAEAVAELGSFGLKQVTMALFSKRYAHTPAEPPFQRESVSRELRTALWNVLKLCIWDRWEAYQYGWTHESERINDLVQRIWIHLLKEDVDHLPSFHRRDSRKGAYDILKEHFFGCKWYEVFDLIEFMAKDRDSFVSSDIATILNETLGQENSAYRLVGQEMVEVTDQHQIAAIQKALEVPAPPVRAHFSAALSLLTDRAQPDFRNSIKESISAVEAACREVACLPKATLGDALKKVPGLHPALQKAFSNLYGYTNDADGIRHALLEETDLTKQDATFMLVTCSAFVGFLYEKAKK